jgi:WD40 repeat protein
MQHVHLNTGNICGLAFLPDGKNMIVRDKSGFGQSSLRWLNRTTLQEWARCETHDSAFTLTPDYLWVAYQTRQGLRNAVIVWDVVRTAEVARLDLNWEYATAMCFSPDGQVLFLAIEERFDDIMVNYLWTWKIGEGWSEKKYTGDQVGNIACSNNGLWLAFSEDQAVRVMDRWNNCLLASWNRQDGTHRLVFSPHDRFLSTIVGAGAMLWDVAARALGPVLGGHTGAIHDVDFTADARIAGTAGEDGAVRLWEAATGRLLNTLSWGIGPLGTLAFSPDGLTAATGGAAGQLLVWDLDDM